jgi:hypothetical protein
VSQNKKTEKIQNGRQWPGPLHLLPPRPRHSPPAPVTASGGGEHRRIIPAGDGRARCGDVAGAAAGGGGRRGAPLHRHVVWRRHLLQHAAPERWAHHHCAGSGAGARRRVLPLVTPDVAPGFFDMFILAFVERLFRPTFRKVRACACFDYSEP